MMKFDLISDLHFSNLASLARINLKPTSNILVMAGDIAEISDIDYLNGFFRRVSNLWEQVIYVPGNHEFYGSLVDDWAFLKAKLSEYENIQVAHNKTVTIEGVRFICSTLWTNFENANPMVMRASSQGMNDFRCIGMSRGNGVVIPFSVDDCLALFYENVSFLTKELKNSDPCIVVTHHAPTFASLSKKYAGSPINGAFASDLSELILDHPQIKCWVHGHTHTGVSYTVGETKVICHPLGYAGETQYKFGKYSPLLVSV